MFELAIGKGAHGLYFSRDSKWLYVSNRGEGSVSVIDVRTRTVSTKWTIPGGGSPDMGGVSADGKVRRGPHGLCVYPQPGRYSLGHTGNMR